MLRGDLAAARAAWMEAPFEPPKRARRRTGRKSLLWQEKGIASDPSRALAMKRRARDSNPQPASRHLISSPVEEAKNPGKDATSQESAAQGAALRADSSSADPQLASVIDAWPTLPPAIQDSILAIIQATGGRHA